MEIATIKRAQQVTISKNFIALQGSVWKVSSPDRGKPYGGATLSPVPLRLHQRHDLPQTKSYKYIWKWS